MQLGLPISIGVHLAVVLGSWAWVGVFSGGTEMATRFVPVEIVTVGDETNIRAQQKTPETPPEVTSDTPLEAAVTTPEITLQNKPDEPDTFYENKTDTVEEDPKITPEEDTRPDLDLNAWRKRVGDLREDDTSSKSDALEGLLSLDVESGDETRSAIGDGTGMTISQMDELRRRMNLCWRIPDGAPEPEKLVVRLRIELTIDGRVSRVRVLNQSAITASGDPFYQEAAIEAQRAVRKCAPYDFLPGSRYDSWKTLILNFKPPAE